MLIGYLSFFSDNHTEVEIADYLEFAGHEVHRYHYTQVDQKKFLEKDFDLVITALPQAFPVSFWNSIKCPKIAWYFDWIQGWEQREKQYLPIVKHFDLILSTDGFENRIYNGMNRHWLPHAVDTRVYKPCEGTPKYEVGFIGHCYTPYRKRLLKNLDRSFNFKWMGNSEECWGPKYAEACASVKIMVGDNCRNDIPGYWSDRLYLSLACGSFLMYPNVPGIEKYFKDGEHLVLYKSEADLHKKIKYYLAAPEERAHIARAGASHAARFHNWSIRIAEFEEILKTVPKMVPLLDRK